MDTPGYLVVRRDVEGRGRYRAWRIIVDERELARIKRGETVTVDLPAGAHNLYIRVDWTRSRKYDILIRPGEALRLRCGSNMPDALAVAVPARDYISLVRDDQPAEE